MKVALIGGELEENLGLRYAVSSLSTPILTVAAMLFALAVGLFILPGEGRAESCENVVAGMNGKLAPRARTNEAELVAVLRSLNGSGNRKLPPAFVTKKQARRAGWRPGSDLWASPALKGKSIGGDSFGNREGLLPDGGRRWREADLDYQGGRRGAKRIIFSQDGLRMVTVDHYRSFIEVPPCQ